MIDFSFSIYDLEYFLLIFVRVSCFVYIAPYFGMNDTPARIRIGISAFTAILLYETLTPVDAVMFDTVMEYAVIVMKEAIAGLLQISVWRSLILPVRSRIWRQDFPWRH